MAHLSCWRTRDGARERCRGCGRNNPTGAVARTRMPHPCNCYLQLSRTQTTHLQTSEEGGILSPFFGEVDGNCRTPPTTTKVESKTMVSKGIRGRQDLRLVALQIRKRIYESAVVHQCRGAATARVAVVPHCCRQITTIRSQVALSDCSVSK